MPWKKRNTFFWTDCWRIDGFYLAVTLPQQTTCSSMLHNKIEKFFQEFSGRFQCVVCTCTVTLRLRELTLSTILPNYIDFGFCSIETSCTFKRCFYCMVFSQVHLKWILNSSSWKIISNFEKLPMWHDTQKESKERLWWINSPRPFLVRTYLFKRYFLIEPDFAKVTAVFCSLFSLLLCFCLFFFPGPSFFFCFVIVVFCKNEKLKEKFWFWAFFFLLTSSEQLQNILYVKQKKKAKNNFWWVNTYFVSLWVFFSMYNFWRNLALRFSWLFQLRCELFSTYFRILTIPRLEPQLGVLVWTFLFLSIVGYNWWVSETNEQLNSTKGWWKKHMCPVGSLNCLIKFFCLVF